MKNCCSYCKYIGRIYGKHIFYCTDRKVIVVHDREVYKYKSNYIDMFAYLLAKSRGYVE